MTYTPEVVEIDDLYHTGDPEPCVTCGGLGVVLVCVDDLCHGLGECIHGDGEAYCTDCQGFAQGVRP